MIIAFVPQTILNGNPATVIRGSRSLCASFVVRVWKKSVAFIGHTIILSDKGSEFQSFMVQRVLHKTKLLAQLMKMLIQLF